MKYSGTESLDRLRALLPDCQIRLTNFPSGAFMIDIPIGDETHVVEYIPEMGLGVSRMSTATFGWEGVENQFSTFEDMEGYLVGLVKAGSTT